MDYTKHVAKHNIPQTEKADPRQIANNGGGYSFEIDQWAHLHRFLCLGTEGGTYYVTEKELTKDNAQNIMNILQSGNISDGIKLVDTIVSVSKEGIAPKNGPAIFALAMASVFGNEDTRAYANSKMPEVCRIATHLYEWVDNCIQLKGGKKSTSLKRAIRKWYANKSVKDVAYQVCKYPHRNINGRKYSHRDMLRISRPKARRDMHSAQPKASNYDIAFQYATHGLASDEDVKNVCEGKVERIGLSPLSYSELEDNPELKYIWAHEQAKSAQDAKTIVDLMDKYNITRESIPKNFLKDIEVGRKLIEVSPMTALLRSASELTGSGVLKPLDDYTYAFCEKLTNEENLRKGRIHPMNIMTAWYTYKGGYGRSSSWNPVSEVTAAMEQAFYKSFKYAEPTGKKILLGIDVSVSMDLTPRQDGIRCMDLAAAMALIIARVESHSHMIAFSEGVTEIDLSGKSTLGGVRTALSGLPFSSTDCAAPMLYAIKEKLDVDCFMVLTDNETNWNSMHPHVALQQYRQKFKKDARMIVVAFAGTNHTIADPNDPGMLDICGFDSSVPQLVSNFISGKI